MKKVIGIVGLPASGKGEVSRIARSMGLPVVVMGDAIRKRVSEAGLPATDRNLGAMAQALRAELGMDAIARFMIPIIEARPEPIVVVDGIRGDFEVQTFKKHFPDFVLVGVVSSFETRLERLASRGRSDDHLTAEELHIRDERERAWGLGRALEQADYTLENEGSLDDLARQVRDLLSREGEAV